MRNKLNILQIICLIGAMILPQIDEMFTWWVYTILPPVESKKISMSMSNLMEEQMSSSYAMLFITFYVIIVIAILLYIIQIFKEHEFWNKKTMIACPTIVALWGIMLMMMCDNYSSSHVGYDNTVYVSVSLNLLAYIEIGILVTTVLVECYKQFKLDD